MTMWTTAVAAYAFALAVGAMAVPTARADEPPAIQLTIKDHKFSPAEVRVRSGQPTFIEVTNADSTPEEFEMRQLALEKVISAGGRAKIRLRPLAPGRYAFIGEFNADTAQGVIVAE